MSPDPSDSAYDLAPVPRQRPRNTPPPLPQPVPLTYRRIEPAAVPPQQPEQPQQIHKMSFSERLYYWLRRLGCAAIILLGVGWLLLMNHFHNNSIVAMSIGFGLIGTGFALFLFAGPTDAEKRGYHF
ncbi:MAG: hypothetical protein ABSC42_11265 [Tepidisphaeraceae bacterium]|jgi:hypothetical protein